MRIRQSVRPLPVAAYRNLSPALQGRRDTFRASSAPTNFRELVSPGRAMDRVVHAEKSGIVLDQYGQVMPLRGQAVKRRIADSLLDIRHRVIQAIHGGKHVIYFPGSYDLMHVGHASYIMEGIEHYLAHNSGLKRDDLYVVVLTDDDDLISGVKPPHLMAAKGEHPRPIECMGLFEHITDQHPRLMDLASLPIDLVGFIPAPSTFGHLLNHGLFQGWLALPGAQINADPATIPGEIVADVQRYNQLVDNIRGGRFKDVKAAFQRARYNLNYDPKTSAWDVSSWQLMVHRFIGDVYQPVQQRNYRRFISVHDVKYKDLVAMIMQICGIGHVFVDDVEVVSTTKLVEAFGWEALVRSKLAGFEALLDP